MQKAITRLCNQCGCNKEFCMKFKVEERGKSKETKGIKGEKNLL